MILSRLAPCIKASLTTPTVNSSVVAPGARSLFRSSPEAIRAKSTTIGVGCLRECENYHPEDVCCREKRSYAISGCHNPKSNGEQILSTVTPQNKEPNALTATVNSISKIEQLLPLVKK